jgi:hypothetical protein
MGKSARREQSINLAISKHLVNTESSMSGGMTAENLVPPEKDIFLAQSV